MKCSSLICYCLFLVFLFCFCNDASGQEAPFELPVQLVGFPFIIGSVKLTNFLKKLTYSLSPATYRARTRRQLTNNDPVEPFDVLEVDKYIVSEFGEKACIFERVCARYATRAQAVPRPQLDWPRVFMQYKRSADHSKEFYLLSVFMGDIVGSPLLCHQLGKRRGCNEQLLLGN